MVFRSQAQGFSPARSFLPCWSIQGNNRPIFAPVTRCDFSPKLGTSPGPDPKMVDSRFFGPGPRTNICSILRQSSPGPPGQVSIPMCVGETYRIGSFAESDPNPSDQRVYVTCWFYSFVGKHRNRRGGRFAYPPE
jgi:hypothetical protein